MKELDLTEWDNPAKRYFALRQMIRSLLADRPEDEARPALHFRCYDAEEDRQYHAFGTVQKAELGAPPNEAASITVILSEPEDALRAPVYEEQGFDIGDEVTLDLIECGTVTFHTWVLELGNGIIEPLAA